MVTKSIAVEKLEGIIERGQAKAHAALEAIERDIPKDLVLPHRAMKFQAWVDEAKKPLLVMSLGGEERRLHDNAFRQALDRVGMPIGFAKPLMPNEWGRELIARNVTEILEHSSGRALIRSVGQRVMGVLSDSYRRLDARPVTMGFVEEAQATGAIVVNGHVGELNVQIQAIRPEIVWVNGDPVVIGIALTTSDFGRGALSMRLLQTRLVCDNGATRDEVMRAVHLGKRLADDITFSERTYALDTRTTASAIRDIVRNELNPGRLQQREALLLNAANTVVDIEAVSKGSLKKTLTKGEMDDFVETFTFGDETQVPEGRNAWRLSNALSWVAKKAETPERRLDLERVAGELLTTTAPAATLLEAAA